MSRAATARTFIALIAIWLLLSFSFPWFLSDKNDFLKNFVNHEFLSFMGVIVTITLASAANLHIELNKCEERAGQAVFTKTKLDVKHSAQTLIVLLAVSVVIVVAKPWVGGTDTLKSLLNGFVLLIIFFSISIMVDLTRAAFTLTPHGK